jgi:hypothetical protein
MSNWKASTSICSEPVALAPTRTPITDRRPRVQRRSARTEGRRCVDPRAGWIRPTRARPWRFVAAWLAGALMAAAGAPTPAATANGGSGVQGRVALSPTCGGAQREGVDCHAAFAGVEIRLLDDGGSVVAAARTAADGRYVLAATAGHYRLQVMTPVKLVRCPPTEVTVPVGAYAAADIDCDSGLR